MLKLKQEIRMHLAKLTNIYSGTPIYLNPDHVVAVVPETNGSLVVTTALSASGSARVFEVAEEVDAAVTIIEQTSLL